MSQGEIDLEALDAHQLVELVDAVSEDELRQGVRLAGTERVLERIFSEMPDRFRPSAAPERADIQFVIEDEGVEHPYAIQIRDSRCATQRARLADPRVALEMGVTTFLQLITGHTSGPTAFMTRRLRLEGDMMFATQILNFFDRPTR